MEDHPNECARYQSGKSWWVWIWIDQCQNFGVASFILPVSIEKYPAASCGECARCCRFKISFHEHNLKPILTDYIYQKNKKGKPPKKDLLLLKNDITGIPKIQNKELKNWDIFLISPWHGQEKSYFFASFFLYRTSTWRYISYEKNKTICNTGNAGFETGISTDSKKKPRQF